MSLICPHCGKVVERGSFRQREAYRLVIIKGLSQRDAARRMGIRRSGVTMLLWRLRRSLPELFNDTHKKILSYDSSMDYSVRRKF